MANTETWLEKAAKAKPILQYVPPKSAQTPAPAQPAPVAPQIVPEEEKPLPPEAIATIKRLQEENAMLRYEKACIAADLEASKDNEKRARAAEAQIERDRVRLRAEKIAEEKRLADEKLKLALKKPPNRIVRNTLPARDYDDQPYDDQAAQQQMQGEMQRMRFRQQQDDFNRDMQRHGEQREERRLETLRDTQRQFENSSRPYGR